MRAIYPEILRCPPGEKCCFCNPPEKKVPLFGEGLETTDSSNLLQLHRHHLKLLEKGEIKLPLNQLAIIARNRCADPLCIYCNPPAEACKSLVNWIVGERNHKAEILKAVTEYDVLHWEIPRKLEGFKVVGESYINGERWIFRETPIPGKIQGIPIKDIVYK